MRPINLKLSAFGSFVKPTEINFERGLDGSQIFLIHGPTGSGKTTLLDAICYALYEESSGGTSDGGRDKKNFRSEFADDTQDMSVDFTFAMNNSTFRIKRTTSGKGSKKSVELYKDGILQADKNKTTDVNDFIKNLLGFDASQFRQVVILPQGKFREFLIATSSKREELLSVIFNAGFYAAVENGLKEKAKFAKAEVDKLEVVKKSYLQGLSEVGEENFSDLLEKISAQVAELKISVEKNKIAASDAQKNLTEGKFLNQDFLQAESIRKKLSDAEENLKIIAEKISPAQNEFEKRKAEEVTRQNLVKKIGDLQKISDVLNDFKKKSAELEKAVESEKIQQEKIASEENLLKKYEATILKREQEIENLQGAEGRFKEAEQNLKLAKDKGNRLQELDNLQKILVSKRKVSNDAEKKYNDAYKNLEQKRYLQRMGAAALLAKNLADGEPCPVCGAVHHPILAKSETLIPNDKEIADAEKNLKDCDSKKVLASKAVTAAEQKINSAKAEVDKLAGVLKLSEAQKIFDAAQEDLNKLNKAKKNLRDGKILTQEKRDAFEVLKKDFDMLTKSVENLRGVVETIQNQIPQEYFGDAKKISADLSDNQNLLKDLNLKWKQADEVYHKLLNQKSEQEGEIKSETENFREISAKIADKVQPDLDALQKISKDAQEVYLKSLSAKTELQTKLNQLSETKNKFDALENEIDAAKKNFDLWSHLSRVASGEMTADKISFRRSYLQSIFRDIVEESNARLDAMSDGRYRFIVSEELVNKHNKSGGLDIKIFDAYTGKARIANTLSGGESFLAALSLALGLASVVKNISGGVKLDTLFVDEGFGSLDSEALDAAIEVLESLQAGGRLVGIISHVDELKQRLPARLEVKKSQRGSSAEFVK